MLRSKTTGTAAAALAVGLLCATAMPAFAQSLEELRRRIDDLQKQIDRLEEEQHRAREAAEEAAAAEASDWEIKWEPAPTIRTKDGRFVFDVRGRLQADYVYASGEENTVDANTMEFRRARLGVEGIAWYDIGYMFEIDFADDEVSIEDAFVSFLQLDPVIFTIGQFETPNSLSEQTSSRFITFMERAQFTDAFELNRRLGAAVTVEGANWHAKGGVFFQNTSDEDAVSGPGENAFGAIAARAHYAVPLAGVDGGDFIHLGTSVRYRNCDNDVPRAGACTIDEDDDNEQRPFFHATDVRTIGTGVIDNVKSDVFWGPELGLFVGALAIKGEGGFLWGQRDSEAAGVQVNDFGPFWGAYVDVAYFLTGESQPYDEAGGDMTRPQVQSPVFNGGWGAWEVAARFDYLSLNDSDNGINGGEQWLAVAGVNWWLNRWTKIQVNYAHVQVNGGPVALEVGQDFTIDGFGIRAQVDW